MNSSVYINGLFKPHRSISYNCTTWKADCSSKDFSTFSWNLIIYLNAPVSEYPRVCLTNSRRRIPIGSEVNLKKEFSSSNSNELLFNNDFTKRGTVSRFSKKHPWIPEKEKVKKRRRGDNICGSVCVRERERCERFMLKQSSMFAGRCSNIICDLAFVFFKTGKLMWLISEGWNGSKWEGVSVFSELCGCIDRCCSLRYTCGNLRMCWRLQRLVEAVQIRTQAFTELCDLSRGDKVIC